MHKGEREVLRLVVQNLRAAADLLESAMKADPEVIHPSHPHFVTRKTAKQFVGVEGRVFDRAVKELRSLRPGRELVIAYTELVAWVEKFERENRVSDDPEIAEMERAGIKFSMDPKSPLPYPYEMFKKGLRRKRG